MDPLSIAAVALPVLGSLFKGVTGFIFGNQQNALEKARAQQAQEEGSVNAGIALQQGNEVAARAATQAAANGGGLGGSAMSVISSLSHTAMFNARNQVYRGATEAAGDIYAGKVAKQQGVMDLVSGGIDAAGKLFGGLKSAGFHQQMLSNFSKAHGEGDSGSDGGGSFSDQDASDAMAAGF